MADAGAWNQGWVLGAERAQEGRLHKQALSDKEFLEKHDNLVKQRDAIEANLPSLKGTPEYDKATADLTKAEKAIREHWHPDNTPPGMMTKFGHKLTDAMRLTSPEKRDEQAKAKTAAGDTRDVQATQRDIAAAAPSEEQKATAEAKAKSAGALEMIRGKMNNWKEATRAAGLPEPTLAEQQAFMTELIQQSSGLAVKGSYVNVSGKLNGIPTVLPFNKNTGKYLFQGAEVFSPDNWEVDPKAIAGAKLSKPTKGPVVPYSKSDTGWVMQMMDPYDPLKIVALVRAEPPARLLGTQSKSKSTDAFGVTTKSDRTTTPIRGGTGDESYLDKIPMARMTPDGGVETIESQAPQADSSSSSSPVNRQLPQTSSPDSGSPKKAPKSASAPVSKTDKPGVPSSTVGRLVPNPTGGLPLDEEMHIPSTTKDNPYVREKANELLDGVAMKDLGIPGKDSAAVEALARQYGWGQGAYLPRELKQIQNADQFLDSVLGSKAFMKSLDSGFFQKWKMGEAETDPKKEGFMGRGAHQLAVQNLSPDQQEYVRLRQVMLGTISGLSSVVRTGRPTEATINRLAQEIPDVMSSASSKDARARIENIKREIAVALKQGVPKPSLTGHLDNKSQPEAVKPAISPEVIKSLRDKLLQAQ